MSIKRLQRKSFSPHHLEYPGLKDVKILKSGYLWQIMLEVPSKYHQTVITQIS